MRPSWIAVWLLLLAAGCDWPGRPKDADRPIPTDQVEDFGTLYSTHCAGCHGSEGKNGPAPPHNDPLFLALVPDAELQRVITEGRVGTPMTAFAKNKGGPLTEMQIEVLAQGIKQKWAEPDQVRGHPPPYLLSSAKAGDKKAGREVFARDCAMCHGERGRGGGAGAINDAVFLALVSDQALRRYIITGRPDFGMPNYADPKRGNADLTSQEINDLVALLAYWRVGGSVNDK